MTFVRKLCAFYIDEIDTWQGTHFKYKRCNRKELQKDVDKLKKKIKTTIARADDQVKFFDT